jgi:quercetin 2,3-dioxygenase
VRRTLPAQGRPLVGAWCFADHYGPDRVRETGGMTVPPHPHTGLQTVSWLFTGEIEHRDSAGHHAFVRPGELNLMTAGRGISHSEVSTTGTPVLHGVQLWVALPDASRFVDPGFEHYVPETLAQEDLRARVFLGRLLGTQSPVRTHSPLVGAELELAAGARVSIPVEPAFEHGVLVDSGAVEVDGASATPGTMAVVGHGRPTLSLRVPEAAPARVLLLGGEPLGEPIVMWWNFVGRDHDEIVSFRQAWQAEIGAGPPAADSSPGSGAPVRYGLPVGDRLAPLPAPTLPPVRLRPRTVRTGERSGG